GPGQTGRPIPRIRGPLCVQWNGPPTNCPAPTGPIMNPIAFALRHPVTVLVAVVALLAGGGLAVYRMKVDVFPSLNLPVVYVCQPYGGMDPAQMEGLLANYYEYHFLYVGGIHHVES